MILVTEPHKYNTGHKRNIIKNHYRLGFTIPLQGGNWGKVFEIHSKHHLNSETKLRTFKIQSKVIS